MLYCFIISSSITISIIIICLLVVVVWGGFFFFCPFNKITVRFGLCPDEDKLKLKKVKTCFDSEASDAADLPDLNMCLIK